MLWQTPSLLAADSKSNAKPNNGRLDVTDFSRSFCFFAPTVEKSWRVRIQLECSCKMIDATTGRFSEIMLGVRTQSGAWRNPPNTPGYDFWMVFSKQRDYIKRVQTSSYLPVSSHVDHTRDYFLRSGWHLECRPAVPLRSADEIRDALTSWRRIVAQTEFRSADGSLKYVIEYPVKWASTNLQKDEFRVVAGPVLLLDPEKTKVDEPPEFDDLQWAYLDFDNFKSVHCVLERPTSVLASVALQGSSGDLSDHNPALTAEQVDQIEKRLYTGWDLPIPADDLRKVFQTNHHSVVEHHGDRVVTTLYALSRLRAGQARRLNDR